MSSYNRNITIRGPGIQLEQLIQLRHGAKNIKPPNKTNSRSSLGGSHRSAFRGRGMDFDEVRIYQAGDDIRSIDWRVTARTAKTHTKIFREEKERPVLLAIDQGNSMFFGSKVTYKSVIAAELAALLAWSTLQNQDRIGGIVFNRHEHAEIKPKRSKTALLGLLKLITDFNGLLFEQNKTPGVFSIHLLLEKLRYMARPGSTVYLISDFYDYDEEAERLLYLIRRHTEIYAIIITDEMEKNIPINHPFSITDGINKISINASSNIASQYLQSFEKKQKSLEISFNKIGVSYKNVLTYDDPHQSLRALLNSRHGKKSCVP